MALSAKVLADSICGSRLTTLELTFPRVILAEFNTHRMISRNAASSRAIPTEKLVQRAIDDPFIPEFRMNQKGMQAGEALEEKDAEIALKTWLDTRNIAVDQARKMHKLNCHKQYVNRLLEPWMWCTVIASATDWDNLFHLRCNPEAEPSFQKIAWMAYEAMKESKPVRISSRGSEVSWHLPLVFEEDRELFCTDDLKKISVGRCARVSYLTHDGKRDPQADIDLCNRLSQSGHWSPFEHVAYPTGDSGYVGNFSGWSQFRKEFERENIHVFGVRGRRVNE
jgi:thymidylate synthase ThyX